MSELIAITGMYQVIRAHSYIRRIKQLKLDCVTLHFRSNGDYGRAPYVKVNISVNFWRT